MCCIAGKIIAPHQTQEVAASPHQPPSCPRAGAIELVLRRTRLWVGGAKCRAPRKRASRRLMSTSQVSHSLPPSFVKCGFGWVPIFLGFVVHVSLLESLYACSLTCFFSVGVQLLRVHSGLGFSHWSRVYSNVGGVCLYRGATMYACLLARLLAAMLACLLK